MNTYFESSYLTWELTPTKNREFILDRFKHLEYLEENEVNTWKHSETSDYYFQQRPIGGDWPFPVSDLNISITEFISILLSHGLASTEKNTWTEDQHMDEYRQHIQHAACFSNSSYAIFFSSENNLVKYIWFDYDDHASIESDRLVITQLLNHLGESYSLTFIDWYEKRVIDLTSKETIIQYLDDTTGNSGLAQAD
jgi:hypothetical protein